MVWYKEGEGATSCFSIRLPVLLLVEDVGLWLLLVLGTQVYRKPVGVVVAAGSAAITPHSYCRPRMRLGESMSAAARCERSALF